MKKISGFFNCRRAFAVLLSVLLVIAIAGLSVVTATADTSSQEKTIPINHHWNNKWSSNDDYHWIDCNLCVATKAFAKHTPEADDGDCTTPVKCTVCGRVLVAAKKAHNAGTGDYDCTTPIYCKNEGCEQIAVPASAHKLVYKAFTNTIYEACTNRNCCHTATAKIVAPEGLQTYNPEVSHDATVVYSEKWLGGELTVSYTKNGQPVDNTIDAGAYIACITKDCATACVAYVVYPASGEVSNISALNKVYDGVAVNAPTYDTLSTGEATIEYKVQGASDETYTTEAPKDAGKYTVRVTVACDGNYKESSAEADFEIFQKEIGLDWKAPANLVYDGTAKEATATATNVVEGDTVNVTVALSKDNDNVNVGKFTFEAVSLDNNNYKLPENVVSPVYEITQATPETNFPDGFKLPTYIDGVKTKLSDIDLTGFEGYTWDVVDTEVAYGTFEYSMTFTPEDTRNYKTVTAMVSVEGLDVTAPTGELTIGENSWNKFLNTITFGIFFKETQTVDVTTADTESGVLKTEYYLADKALTEDELKEITDWTAFEDKFNIEPNNNYVVYVKITDKAGNAAIINSDGVVLDNIPPVISGAEDGETYYEELELTVTDANLDRVEVDGKVVEISEDGKFTLKISEKEQVIKAYDKAGNETAAITVLVTEKVIPQTGDSSNIALWIALFVTSLAGLVVLTSFNKHLKKSCK